MPRFSHRPIVLIILDGWGYTDNTFYNAIHSAKKPVWEKLWLEYPHTLINASGTEVGLPATQMGNSEVGHMNIGSGRIVKQEFSRITQAIQDGSFNENEILCETFQLAISNGNAVHLVGLLSQGGVHGHRDHIFKLMEMAIKKGVEKIYLHASLDGRDVPPKSAEEDIYATQLKIRELGKAKLVSIIGRHFSMDRNKHWDRTQQAYDLISQGKANYRSHDPFLALDMAYARGETDEFINATTIIQPNKQPVRINDGDIIIFANYRADRARQLTRAFTKKDFQSFPREHFPN